ncbi:MAG TPA: sulfotransferase, partial [Methylomirabilota bacterium]|nr:sulfotransferase [Methylomirabilota bacterium]
LVALGRALDHLLFPGFKRQPVRDPVFIIAPPRSGTTLTQKLMAKDEERFACVRLYETIFPSVTFHRCLDALVGLDGLLGRPFARLIEWAEKKFFGGWDDMHKMRFNQPEEDDGFFVYTFCTEAIYLLFPYVRELWGAGFCDDLPAEDRRKVMRYYRSCLQRHLYAVGPHKTLLSKATQFSGSVLSLLDEFPDARIITIIRDPARSIASHVSVFYPVWKTISPEITKDSPESKAYAELAAAWFRHLLKTRDCIDPARYYCIRYTDLVRNPRDTIGDVYRHFGWTMSPSYAAFLESATQKQRDFTSAHHYSLEEFGLDEAWLRREVGEVLEYYALRA